MISDRHPAQADPDLVEAVAAGGLGRLQHRRYEFGVASRLHFVPGFSAPGVELLGKDVVAPRNLRDIGPRLHVLGDEPRLRLRRPDPPFSAAGEHLHPLRVIHSARFERTSERRYIAHR
jgi:hypothetical protein